MLIRCVAEVSCAFPIELRHKGVVRVPDEYDGRVVHLDVLPPTLMSLHADRPAALPIIFLALEAYEERRNGPGAYHDTIFF